MLNAIWDIPVQHRAASMADDRAIVCSSRLALQQVTLMTGDQGL